MNKYYSVAVMLISLQLAYGAEQPLAKEQLHNWDVKTYEQNSSLQYHFASKVLSTITLDAKDRVLDVGCGFGNITSDIGSKVVCGYVFGIDPSQTMIDKARVDNAKRNMLTNNVVFEQADIAQFKTNLSFTKVFAFFSLSWVKDQDSAYKNIAQALASGGTFRALVSDPECDHLEARKSMLENPKWKKYFENYEYPYYTYDKQTHEDRLKASGLIPVCVEKFVVSDLYMSPEQLIAAMKAIPIQKERIPQDLQEDFFQEILAKYLKKNPVSKNGLVKINTGVLLIEAQKP